MSEEDRMLHVVVLSDDSNESSPCDQLEQSFASIASSLGPPCTAHSDSFSFKGGDVLYEFDEENSEESEETPAEAAERMRQERHYRLRYGPSRANRSHDRQSILSARQNLLNEFILRETKEATVSRQDHHIMLRQLISAAYFRDPNRVSNRPLWRRIMAAIGKEYYGSKAIFSLSPDPYESVVAKLSSMMLWDDEIRHWAYGYCDSEITRRRNAQVETLKKLEASGRLFL
ncbi:conserved hypothetical protein [Leishmania infantum JPCM5]|uniref:Uncharacterized protein n=2 Tax=Leishmania infantum TaxID=5671 RepID=A4I663_LEIIN|nr:conserved hypothetical protein [Leishmania infantum JPCM5]CAC9515658.1 hypothetical_protein_-_conserved [Leishmania infantum]CAM70285.1 conserved hypothetical protein [Leishmania infantum JPCM5]SUZ44137.1 hypothetical_protein_-_conserved [Leishmania infantum]|eukprot:XP_001467232.1 conserved hypothetical protein [Leishmania infantum JPCM5]